MRVLRIRDKEPIKKSAGSVFTGGFSDIRKNCFSGGLKDSYNCENRRRFLPVREGDRLRFIN